MTSRAKFIAVICLAAIVFATFAGVAGSYREGRASWNAPTYDKVTVGNTFPLRRSTMRGTETYGVTVTRARHGSFGWIAAVENPTWKFRGLRIGGNIVPEQTTATIGRNRQTVTVTMRGAYEVGIKAINAVISSDYEASWRWRLRR